ncbi:MAG: hypothetical protein WCF85_19625 [Rhodospirillaceae bacterium]
MKPIPGNADVMDGVLGITVTEVVMDEAQVGAAVGQGEPAGVM